MSEHSDLKEEATAVVKQYIEYGRGAEGSTKVYNDSGAKYDEYMEVLNYSAPAKTATIVADLLKENFDAKILDVGAGTGRAGLELAKLGYKNIDAVDAAENLLEVAREKKIYDKIICQFVGQEKLPFDNELYDLALSCGAMQENHLPLEAFLEIIRVVKPGGYIVTVFRAEAATAPWYRDGVEAFMSKLEETYQWKLQSRNIFPNFIGDKDGLALVHKVLEMSEHGDLRDEAASVLNQFIERGRGAEGSVQVYSESGSKYKEYMIALRYIGPSKTAEVVAGLLEENFDANILDIGAGTGLVADELVKLGYKNLDAVDAAEGMLEIAREKKIYGKIVCQFVGREKMPFDDDSYDVALTCGAVQENHLPLEAILDIIRVVKSGGYIVNVFRAEAANAPWYKEGLETFLSKLEEKGVVKQQSRDIFPDFVTGKDGMALVHKVL